MKVNRPEKHKIGELAEIAVTELFTSAGWIVNKTVRDYGEDISVQICRRGIVTPFRFYVQVKGTNDISKFERKKFYSCGGISRYTIARWLLSSDIIVLILWDINKRSGVYGFIQDIFNEALFGDEHGERLTTRLLKSYLVNEKAVDIIGKQAMLKWASKASREAQVDLRLASDGIIDAERAKAHYVNVGLELLIALEMVCEINNNDGIAYYINDDVMEEFIEEFSALFDKRLRKRTKTDEDLKKIVERCLEATWVLILIRRFNNMMKQPAEHVALNLAWRTIILMGNTASIVDEIAKIVENDRRIV